MSEQQDWSPAERADLYRDHPERYREHVFTCPNCGGHAFGTARDGDDEVWVSCHTSTADGVGGCGFSAPYVMIFAVAPAESFGLADAPTTPNTGAIAAALPPPPLSASDLELPNWVWTAADLAAFTAQFWHGFKRNNDSVLWGGLWGLAGVPLAAASWLLGLQSRPAIFLSSHAAPLGYAAWQGYAKPATEHAQLGVLKANPPWRPTHHKTVGVDMRGPVIKVDGWFFRPKGRTQFKKGDQVGLNFVPAAKGGYAEVSVDGKVFEKWPRSEHRMGGKGRKP
jgi:hypothetical protein